MSELFRQDPYVKDPSRCHRKCKKMTLKLDEDRGWPCRLIFTADNIFVN